MKIPVILFIKQGVSYKGTPIKIVLGPFSETFLVICLYFFKIRGNGRRIGCYIFQDLLDPTNDHIHIFRDRKSTRLNSSHVALSYAVFCLKKKIIGYEDDVYEGTARVFACEQHDLDALAEGSISLVGDEVRG